MTPGSLPVRLAQSAAACILLTWTLAATAQAPGTYRGQNAQGYPMEIVVATASDGVSSEIRSIRTSYNLTCDLPGLALTLSSVVSGFFPVSPDGSFDANYLWDRDYFRTAGHFAGDGTVQGSTTWSIAAVARKAPHPSGVCGSPDLVWTAAAVPASAAARRAPDQATDIVIERHLDRAGRVTSDTLRATR